MKPVLIYKQTVLTECKKMFGLVKSSHIIIWCCPIPQQWLGTAINNFSHLFLTVMAIRLEVDCKTRKKLWTHVVCKSNEVMRIAILMTFISFFLSFLSRGYM